MKFLKKVWAKIFVPADQMAKRMADIEGEPWVEVKSIEFANPDDPRSGAFELDWNNAFIESLIESGYSGRSDDDIVEMWFNDLCRGVLDDERLAGDFGNPL